MSVIQQLEEARQVYEAQMAQARKNARFTDRLFGGANDPRNSPAHRQFYETVQQLVQEFMAGEPDAQDAAQCVRYLLETADIYRENQDIYFFLYAIQALAEAPIGRMTPEDCRAQLERYEAIHPRRDRMPAQEKIYKQLKNRAKE